MSIITNTICLQIDDRIKASKRALIVSHINPDGDSIGSMLGIYWYLQRKGLNADLLVPNTIPLFLQWLPGCDKIIIAEQELELSNEKINEADLIFCLDFNETDRLSMLQDNFINSDSYKILVDHHPNPEIFADLPVSSVEYGSTAEMIYDIIMEIDGLEWIDKKIAECLFTGIMTDTGNFSFSSSNPGTYLAVADLLSTGINKDHIFNLVYENYSCDRMRLMGYSLDKKMTVVPELNTAYIALTKNELFSYNHVVGDTEGFVNLPFSIKGIKISALFIEKEDHIKISFRSRGDFAINKFAEKYFKGGGHKNAAGGESDLDLDVAIELFINKIRSYKSELK